MADGVSEKAKTDFLTWLSEAYGYNWTWLQLPDVLMKFGNKNNQWYQYWAKYIYQPPKATMPAPTSQWPEQPTEIQQETPEIQQRWREYLEGGGSLGYFEWRDFGMPTITEEKSSFAFLGWAGQWLNSQLTSGLISESEADLIIEDLKARLSGPNKYGKRQTVIDLPETIRSDVERYRASLPIAAQREAEQAVQRAQDIASQRMQLPLKAGGTQQQQVLAGYDAIQKLQTQKISAPPYLQSEIDRQITQLQGGISQIQESIKREAGRRTKAMEPAPEIPKEPGEMAKRFADKYGMSPEAAKLTGYNYLESMKGADLPNKQDYSNLTQEQKAELFWVGAEAEGTAPPPAKAPTFNAPGQFEAIGETGSPIWKNWFAQYYPSIARQFQQRPEEQRTEKGWSDFLASERARLREQFASQTPYSRGERPGVFQPRVKTVQF